MCVCVCVQVVFGDWYNIEVMKQIKFFDENTRQLWMPDTGGANLPSLNKLLSPWGISFSNEVLEGEFPLGSRQVSVSSGAGLLSWPKEAHIITADLANQGGWSFDVGVV